MKTIALIPARLESKRFPNKLLKEIHGMPLILKTYKAALKTNLFDEVYVVSGNQQILDLINSEGGHTYNSLKDHKSGTDRIAEAANNISHDLAVNLQGDEPFIDSKSLNDLIRSFDDPNVKIASLMNKFRSFNELKDPNNVKVIVDKNSDAIYFSRQAIPYGSKKINDYNRHIGVYAFLRQSLIDFSKTKRSSLEIIEDLEGNRVIENSHKIRMVSTKFHSVSIDTPEDLTEAKKYFEND